MPTTTGYIGTVRVNDEQTGSRIWVSMTTGQTNADWIRHGDKRAWFFINLGGSIDQPVRMSQFTLLLESMREGLHAEIKHQGASTSVHWNNPGDAFEIDKIRILRKGLVF